MIILTEKPSVAKDIATALGTYKFSNGIWISGSSCIISARGHLLESYMPEDYDEKWKSWKNSFNDLPIIPEHFLYKENEKTIAVLHQIKECFSKFDSSEFILATDAEREGEVIGAEILDYVGYKSPDAKRFWVSEALTPDVVKKGLAVAKPLSNYESYKLAGFARAKADWLIGMNLSRLLTVSLGNQNLFSFGRVQTSILGVIYLRDKNIANFVAQPYYQLACKVTKDNISFLMFYNKDNSDRFTDKTDLEFVQERINKNLVVKNIDVQNRSENAPQLFNITGLQKYCSVNYHLTPQQTLDCAQTLYEKHKCLSYPRTPSIVLGDDNVELYKSKFELLSKKYPELSSACDFSKISSDNKRLFNSAKLSDHHALIPLAPVPDSVTPDERNVYTAVLLRFFQVIMPPCEYNSITLTAYSDNNCFIGKGKSYINKGWRNSETPSESDDEQQENEQTFPTDLQEGDYLDVVSKDILEKKTQPKKHFTNATLLALMENPKAEDVEKTAKLIGLGTPATRASIIEELKHKGYIRQDKQNLLITDSGKFLIETIIQIPSLKDFISLSTTTMWEEQLQSHPSEFLDSIKNFLVTEIPKITITKKWAVASLGACPLCHNGQIAEGKNSYYCDAYKSGCSFSLPKSICNAKISTSDVALLINGKTTNVKKMKSIKTGKDFSAKLRLLITSGNSKIDFVFN